MCRSVPPVIPGKLPLAVILLLGSVAPSSAQTVGQDVAGPEALQAIDTTIGARYRAGALHRLLFGTRYRALWTTRVRVPLLDLRRFAGGLRPLERAGGKRTGSLRLAGADGHEYVLRAADMNAGTRLPPELQGTLVQRLFQDQLSAVHPFGPLVADRLGAAIGLPRLRTRLVVVPNDSALGEFREEFAGMVAYLQEWPAEAGKDVHRLGGFRWIIGTETLLRLRRERQEEVDVPRFLAARVLDLLLGDWDRRRGQWRWGRTDAGSPWQPIPRDRDHAFSQHDGLLLALARSGPAPYLVRFGNGRLPVAGLVWHSRDLDRELLSRLDWPAWDSVVSAVRVRLTDAVIDSAVAEMPSAVPEASGRWLAATLRGRRERLADAARRFYLNLAAEVDLHGTDAAERITVAGEPNGAVRIDFTARGTGAGVSRRFEPSETGEVRVYAHGGADTVATRGERGRVRVRVIGGDGMDVISRHDGPSVRLDQHGADWRPIPREGDPPPPPDWGGRTTFLPVVGANSDAGVVLGLNLTHVDYGFRKLPFANRISAKAAFGTTNSRPGLMVSTTMQTAVPALRFVITAKATGVEVLRLYALGNESEEAANREFHMVRNWQFELTPAVEVTPTRGLLFGAGPRLRYVKSELSADRLIGLARPYGGGGFGEVGAQAYARLDLRDLPTNPRRGLLLELGGDLVAGQWDVAETFGSAYATLATYISAPAGWSPTLYLRAGGRRVWGRYPYFEAARVGGGGSVRGYSNGRFMGDAAVFGQAELRVPLAGAKLLVPGTLGVLGLVDAGRVYLEGESSDIWHTGFGGGVWFAWLGGGNLFSLAVARGTERTTLTFRAGVAF